MKEFVYAHIAHKNHIGYNAEMKVYFTCSTAEFKKYRDDYYTIRNYLVNNNYILTRDWLTDAEKRLAKGNKELSDIKEIYKSCVIAIREADIVIIEDTVSNFSTGHQITLAIQLRKPTLVLWQEKKHKEFNQMFIHGIDSDILQVTEYNKENLSSTIKRFINKFENTSDKNRFHLVLSTFERMYLDWAQYVQGKSRTKVIKAALRNIMDTDEEYKEYLLNKH